MTRYLWRLQPIADLPDDAVVRLIGPAVAAFLVGPLPRPEPASGSTDDGPAA
jgi:hypothetical protein